MDTQNLKDAIRRRSFARALAEGRAEQSPFAREFMKCPKCQGRGKEGNTVSDRSGNPLCHELGVCSFCDGELFIARSMVENKT